MNIFDNLIKDTEIIGISQLNATDDDRGTVHSPYTTYSFRLFLKNTHLTIYSPDFSKQQSVDKDAWLKKYLHYRSIIAVQIGEVQEQ